MALAAAALVGVAIGAVLEADPASNLRYEKDESNTWQGCQPENTSIGRNFSAMEYARMIEPELGVPPVVDCGEGVEQPIYVNGDRSVGNPGLHQCDNPSLQIGDCMSGSSVQRYVGSNADGSPRHDVVWVSFCRHDGRGEVFGFEVLVANRSVRLCQHMICPVSTPAFRSSDQPRGNASEKAGQ